MSDRGRQVNFDAVRELLDIEAIRRLKAMYFRSMDDHDWEVFADLLTDDFEVIFAKPEEQFYPSDATKLPDGRIKADKPRLLAWMKVSADNMTTVHHAHMPVIEIIGSDSATGHWSMTDYTGWIGESGPVWMASYGFHQETYRRTDGRWRICHSVFERHDLYTLDGPPGIQR
jgi:hypothetical protein